jgi:hypothetical protein
VLEYDEEVKYHTALLCILAPLLQPPVGFEKVTQAHFRRKRKLIISTLSKWKRDGSSSLVARLGPVVVCLCTPPVDLLPPCTIGPEGYRISIQPAEDP